MQSDACARVFSAGDLGSARFAPVSLAVFGHPVAHSLSPLMQNAALAEMAKADPRFSEWAYYKFDVPPEELCGALPEFGKAGFAGINLTIPHKEVVFSCAEKNGIEFDEFSRLAGACNTLSRRGDGWLGTNTDGFGLARALEISCGAGFENSDVVIFGAGGAAKAACFRALLDGCASLRISNRTRSRMDALLGAVSVAGYSASALSDLSEIPDGAVLINATSVGLGPDDPPVADFARIPKGCVFFDMPYARGRETASVLAARAAGLRAAASGLEMLAWQGAKSLSVWTGGPLMGAVMSEALGRA